MFPSGPFYTQNPLALLTSKKGLISSPKNYISPMFDAKKTSTNHLKSCCNHNQQSFGNIWQSYRNDNHHSSNVAQWGRNIVYPEVVPILSPLPQLFPIRYPIRNQPDAIGFFTNQSNNHSKKPFLFPRDIITKTPSSNSLRSLRSSYPNIATEHGPFSSMIYRVFSFKKG